MRAVTQRREKGSEFFALKKGQNVLPLTLNGPEWKGNGGHGGGEEAAHLRCRGGTPPLSKRGMQASVGRAAWEGRTRHRRNRGEAHWESEGGKGRFSDQKLKKRSLRKKKAR